VRSRWAAAESLRRDGRIDPSRERLIELEARFEDGGGGGHLGRVRRSLRQCGVRRAVRSEPVPGSLLTVREREILELVGHGHRTAEIASRLGVSRWAVTRAVGSATAKLGAATTAEALMSVAG
jgi:DNA-binding CsgD family transcriptional regulator